MSPAFIRICSLVIGLIVCIAIPNMIIIYLAYIILLESSIKEINMFSWIYDNIICYILKTLPFKDNIRTVFIDKNALDKTNQYILCLHPHGLACQGRILNLINPKLPAHTYFSNAYQAVHSTSFAIPLVREILLLGKSVPANENMLSKCIRDGRNISIYPGGVKEMDYCKQRKQASEKYDYYYLSKHKGFIRLSQKHNIPLVPIVFWNEQRAFTYKSSGIVAQINRFITSISGISSSINFFQVLTLKNMKSLINILSNDIDENELAVYIGEPILFTGMTIDAAHTEYINKLKRLYAYAKEQEKSDRVLVIK